MAYRCTEQSCAFVFESHVTQVKIDGAGASEEKSMWIGRYAVGLVVAMELTQDA